MQSVTSQPSQPGECCARTSEDRTRAERFGWKPASCVQPAQPGVLGKPKWKASAANRTGIESLFYERWVGRRLLLLVSCCWVFLNVLRKRSSFFSLTLRAGPPLTLRADGPSR